MQRSLASASIDCAKLLARLASLHGDAQYSQRSALQANHLEDQSARFQVWAGNLGAFQRLPASASLDYRLRGSPKIAIQILELLQDLEETCGDIRAIALGERPNRRSDADAAGWDAEGGEPEDSEDESAFMEDDSDEEEQELSEAEELFESIKDTLASLFRLAVVIRNSSPRDRYARALGGNNPFIEQFDIAHVGEKFPKLNAESNAWLRDRIGKAIAQRRQYLRYAREHRHKLGKEPVELWKPAAEVPKAFLQAQSQAARTSNSRPVTTVADTTASTLFLQETPQIDVDFRDDQSQTSFALSKGGEEGEDKIQLPRLSEVAKGQASFECPFCWTIQAIRREKFWKKHALADLRPYVCTFGDCDVKLFADRNKWFEHEVQTHRATWRCHFCSHADFPVKEALKNHMHHKHSQIGEDQLVALADAGRRPNALFKASDCPFCDNWDVYLRKKEHPPIPLQQAVVVTLAEFRRHVGAHMQDLALFAIPRGYLEGDGDADSAASARAAGAGKNSASIARSRIALSVDSYDTVPYVEMPRLSENMEAIAEAINKSSRLSGNAYEETLIRILPALSKSELDTLTPRCNLKMDITFRNDRRFRSLANAACRGPLGADALWIQNWASYPPGSFIWLRIVSRAFLEKQRDFSEDVARDDYSNFIIHLQDLGFPFWLIDTLKYIMTRNTAESSGSFPEAPILRDIDVLRASFLAPGQSSAKSEAMSSLRRYLTASNRHLRKIFRLYKWRYPTDDLKAQLIEFCIRNTDFGVLRITTEVFRVLVDHLIKDIANGALDSVTRDAKHLHTALHSAGIADNASETASDAPWEGVAFQVLHLHWEKAHLRAVKSEFEDLFGMTVESCIDSVCNASESAELVAAFLKALVAVDIEDPVMEPGKSLEPDLEETFASSAPYPSMLDPTHSANDVGSDPHLSSGAPAVMFWVDKTLHFEQVVWSVLVMKRWCRCYRQTRIVKELLTSIGQENHTSDSPAWLPILSRYPIFTDCPDFLDAVRPHIQLQGYDADQMILAKGDCSTWVGWLITGTTWYTATYKHNDERCKWVTEENGVTIGLVDTLFDLPSLIEHRTKSPCLLATLPQSIFTKLAQSSADVAQHIATKDFGASFGVTRECLRIEVEFGHPWWHIFHWPCPSDIDRPNMVARILQSSQDPQVIISMMCNIGDISYTPLDLVVDVDDIETAKAFLEHGAKVSFNTIKVLLRNENLEFLELVLNRPGAAEAANELLRSGEREDVTKLQRLLKELQGSVPVNLAVEKEYNVALVEPRNVSGDESGDEDVDTDVDEDDEVISEGDVTVSHADFAAAIEACLENGHADSGFTAHVGQLLDSFSDVAAASAFLNDVPLYNDHGFSPLTGAVKHDCLELMAILLKHGIHTNTADANGLYPLDLAMSSPKGRTEKCVLLLEHGAIKSSQDRRAELAQLKEQVRIAKEYGSEWLEILQSAATSKESLALVKNILENAEHPRLTANILLPSGQTALDVAIAQNNTDLVLLLLEHEAWPAENSALIAAEANSDLDPRVVDAMHKHLPAAFKNSTAAHAIQDEAPEDSAHGNEGTDTEAEQTKTSEHDDKSPKAQIDANAIADDPSTAYTDDVDDASAAAHPHTTQEIIEHSPGPEPAERATQVAVDDKAHNEKQMNTS